MVFIEPDCKVLYSRCQTNNGLPLDIVAGKFQEIFIRRSSKATSSSVAHVLRAMARKYSKQPEN